MLEKVSQCRKWVIQLTPYLYTWSRTTHYPNTLNRIIPYYTLPNAIAYLNTCIPILIHALPILIHWFGFRHHALPILIHWIGFQLHILIHALPILIHCDELYPILIHWTELYPILIHWTELYPIVIHYRIIFSHCKTVSTGVKLNRSRHN